ncbi:hypothetical protein [Streptomyces lushanensis]|nr:hypothetical protein [Streptomyces lushanensis]
MGGQFGGGDLVVAEGVGDDGGGHLQDVLADRGRPAGGLRPLHDPDRAE